MCRPKKKVALRRIDVIAISKKELKIFISLAAQIAAAVSHLPKKIKSTTTTTASFSGNFFFCFGTDLLSANQTLYMSKGISYTWLLLLRCWKIFLKSNGWFNFFLLISVQKKNSTSFSIGKHANNLLLRKFNETYSSRQILNIFFCSLARVHLIQDVCKKSEWGIHSNNL